MNNTNIGKFTSKYILWINNFSLTFISWAGLTNGLFFGPPPLHPARSPNGNIILQE